MVSTRRSLSTSKKLFFASIVVGGFYLILELSLILCGVKPLGSTKDPYVGFQPGVPLFIKDESGSRWTTNPVKRLYFNEQQFPTKKSSKAFRIFCLGGSTTFGHPYDYRTSFSHWLQQRLMDAEPNREWEVINCGGISYASYRVCLLMEELNQYQPDLYIVYTGQNEFLESRTYDGTFSKSAVATWLGPVVSKSRTASLISSFVAAKRDAPNKHAVTLPEEVEAMLDRSVGPVDYHRDEKWHKGVVEHYRNSIERICKSARSVGARVMFVTPASNSRDCSPFKSEHGIHDGPSRVEWDSVTDKAKLAFTEGQFEKSAELFENASRLDPVYAHGLWETGRALQASGNEGKACDYFQRALDEDICPLRAISPICQALREVTKEQDVPLIDYPRLLVEQHGKTLGHYALGDDDFLDHVHPTIEGHRILAWALFDQLTRWKIIPPQTSDDGLVQRIREPTLDGIDERAQALALVQVIQVYNWADKKEEALKLTTRAEEICPGLSEVAAYRGRLLEKLGDSAEAMRTLEEAVRRNPEDLMALSFAGALSLKLHHFADARAYYATAVLNMPTHETTHFRAACRFGLGLAFWNLEQWREADIEFRETLKLEPSHEAAKAHLAQTVHRLKK